MSQRKRRTRGSMKSVYTLDDQLNEIERFHQNRDLEADKLLLSHDQQGEDDMYGSGDDIVGGRTNPDGMMDSSEEDGGSLADFVGDAPSEGDQGEGASDDEFESGWGTKKKAYYGADTQDYEIDSDEERAEMEEVESRRLQKENFALHDEEDFEGLQVLESIVDSSNKKKKDKKTLSEAFDLESGYVMETVERDLSKLTRDERLDIINADSPELVGLFEDLKIRLKEIKQRIRPMLEKISPGDIVLTKARSFLQMRKSLLITYCTDISFYLMLKAEGKQVLKTHPVIRQIVDLRKLVEQSEPLLLEVSQAVERKLRNGNKKADIDLSQEEEDEGYYVERELASDQGTIEVSEPESTGESVGLTRVEEEDDEMMRSLSKRLRARGKSKRKISKMVSTELEAFDDFGELEPERLAKKKKKKAKASSQTMGDGEDIDMYGDMPEGLANALAMYEDTKKKHKKKKDTRQADHPKPEYRYLEVNPDLPPSDAVGKREIGNAIMKNRGLTRSRPRDKKNPRVKHREKYRKALVKRRSQIQEYKGKTAAYGGEKSGIKSNVIKSVSIKG